VDEGAYEGGRVRGRKREEREEKEQETRKRGREDFIGDQRGGFWWRREG